MQFTHKNWRWGSLKILGGIMLILFRFNFTTNKELDKLSKQPASKMVILLLLKFLKWTRLQQQKSLVEQNNYHQKAAQRLWLSPSSTIQQLYTIVPIICSALFLQLKNKNNTYFIWVETVHVKCL